MRTLDKKNYITFAFVLIELIGILLICLRVGIVGLSLCAVGLLGGIAAYALRKKFGLDEVLAYTVFTACVILFVVGAALFGVFTILDIVNAKDIG